MDEQAISDMENDNLGAEELREDDKLEHSLEDKPMETYNTICFYCKSIRGIPQDEHDDGTCLCGEEAWLTESEYNKSLSEVFENLN